MNFCPNCGAKLSDPKAAACPECGFAMPQVPAAGAAAEPAPLFHAAVGPADTETPAAPLGATADDLLADIPNAAPVATPAAPATPPPPSGAAEADLLELLEDVQGKATPVAPKAAAPDPFAQTEESAAQPDYFAAAEAPAAAAPPPAPPADAGLFGEDAPAPGGEADLFTQPAGADVPDLFGEAEVLPPAAAPDFFAEAPAPEAPAAPASPAEDLFAAAPPPPAQPAPPAPSREEAAPRVATGGSTAEFLAAPEAGQYATPGGQQSTPGGQQSIPAPEPSRQVYPAGQPAAGNLFENSGEPDIWQQAARQDEPRPQQQQPARQQAYAQNQPAARPQRERPARQQDAGRDGQKAQRGRSRADAAYDEALPGYGQPNPDIFEEDALPKRAARSNKRHSAPPVRLPEAEPRRQRSAGGTILTWILLVVVFAILVAGTVLVMLYFQNRPAKVVDDFTTAISQQDREALEDLVKLDGVAPTDDGWKALMAAFDKQTTLNTLKAQLLQQADDPESAAELTYPAITIEGRPFLFFIEKYTITVHGVDLLAPGAEAGTVARLWDTDHTGTATPEGEVYTGLMPGRYECRLAAPGTDVNTVAPVEIIIFEVDGVNRIGDAAAAADITIENVLGEVSAVYVNEQPVDTRPEGEVLHLSGVSVGSIIRVETTHEAKAMYATVAFNDINTTTLRFESYAERDNGGGDTSTSQPEADTEALQAAKRVTESDANAVMATFYASYLDAINEQDSGRLKLVTDSGKTTVAERVGSDGNKANLFEYVSVATDNSTLKPSDNDGVATVTFECAFKYRYKPREGEEDWQEGDSRRTIEMVRVDGQWLVNKMT